VGNYLFISACQMLLVVSDAMASESFLSERKKGLPSIAWPAFYALVPQKVGVSKKRLKSQVIFP
jgi:hypothetical protein